MFCSKCGEKMQEDAMFCPLCGWSLSGMSEKDVLIKRLNRQNYGQVNVLGGILGTKLFISLMLLLPVYIGNFGFKIFSKRWLTSNPTIITQKYIDKLIEKYNKRYYFDILMPSVDDFNRDAVIHILTYKGK
jgi:uncharacterized membrane protein YvbJ